MQVHAYTTSNHSASAGTSGPNSGNTLPFAIASRTSPQVRQLTLQFDIDRNGEVDLAEWSAALLDWGALESRSEWEGWVHKVGSGGKD